MDGGFRSVKNAYTSNSSYSEFAVLDGIGRNLYLIYWRNWVISIPDTRGTGFYSLLRNAIQEVLVNIQYQRYWEFLGSFSLACEKVNNDKLNLMLKNMIRQSNLLLERRYSLIHTSQPHRPSLTSVALLMAQDTYVQSPAFSQLLATALTRCLQHGWYYPISLEKHLLRLYVKYYKSITIVLFQFVLLYVYRQFWLIYAKKQEHQQGTVRSWCNPTLHTNKWPIHSRANAAPMTLRDKRNGLQQNINSSLRYRCPLISSTHRIVAVEASSAQRRRRGHGEDSCSTRSHYRTRYKTRAPSLFINSD